MVIAVNPTEVFDYVLKVDRELPAEQQTVFRLRPLTEKEERTVLSKTNEDPVSFAYEALSRCLVGWENLGADDGSQHTFQANGKGGASDASLDVLLTPWRSELATAVFNRGQLDESEGN